MIAAGRHRRDPGLASIKRRLDSCFSWVKYSLVNCIKISGNETDLRKTPEEKFALRVGAPETCLTSITYKGQKAYHEIILSFFPFKFQPASKSLAVAPSAQIRIYFSSDMQIVKYAFALRLSKMNSNKGS